MEGSWRKWWHAGGWHQPLWLLLRVTGSLRSSPACLNHPQLGALRPSLNSLTWCQVSGVGSVHRRFRPHPWSVTCCQVHHGPARVLRRAAEPWGSICHRCPCSKAHLMLILPNVAALSLGGTWRVFCMAGCTTTHGRAARG